jgi:CrcB protein
MLTHYILTGLGGAIGAISRVAASQLFPENIYGIPTQILFINVLGCFFMGALTEGAALYFSISDNMKYFLISGFLGGFTTFSSFALEVGALAEKK